jgi:demethylmenaquinone methyltransferase / 2-methoxy-6-polyprenyl-1,4-benzoquinol methylase
MLATDRKLPLTGGGEKRSYVRAMFGAIAPRYDLLNHLLSLNFDRRWRRQAVAELGWQRAPAGTYLDLCAGTLDLGVALTREREFCGRVIGADFALPMLVAGRDKSARVSPINADALELPFPEEAFQGATVGFGVRNLTDLDAGLREVARVLAPGSRLVILELTTPARQPLRGLYLFYFRRMLPMVGRVISRHHDAYDYLPQSVLEFPEPEALAGRMRLAGFAGVTYRLCLGGICAIHVGMKPGR